jgi:hypothetical protein
MSRSGTGERRHGPAGTRSFGMSFPVGKPNYARARAQTNKRKDEAVSYRSRERKRKRHAGEQAQRRNAKNADPSDYYLTFAKKQSRCFCCAGTVEQRDQIAFRAQPLEVWHKRCADLNGLACHRWCAQALP